MYLEPTKQNTGNETRTLLEHIKSNHIKLVKRFSILGTVVIRTVCVQATNHCKRLSKLN